MTSKMAVLAAVAAATLIIKITMTSKMAVLAAVAIMMAKKTSTVEMFQCLCPLTPM
jgi:hypothetical protein